MFLNRHLVNAAHERRFLVIHDASGWEVIEKEDSAVVRQCAARDGSAWSLRF